MRIGKCRFTNFQSYKELEFDYSSAGLCLVYGLTGSGKSALMDAPLWVMFGQTSKGGKVDGVRSWFAETPTSGSVEIETKDGPIRIHRTRGARNDLYFTEGTNEAEIRGVDIPDTQRKIDARLGVDYEAYTFGACAQQFSIYDDFFLARSKDQKEAIERIANVALANKLLDTASEGRKHYKHTAELLTAEVSKHKDRRHAAENNISRLSDKKTAWDQNKTDKLNSLQAKASAFEQNKKERVDKLVDQIEELDKHITTDADLAARETQIKQQLVALDAVKATVRQSELSIAGLRTEAKNIMAALHKLESLGEYCPTCLGPTENHNRVTEIAELKRALTDVVCNTNNAEVLLAEQRKAASVDAKLKEAYYQIQTDKTNNNQLISTAKQHKNELMTLRNAVNNYDEMIAEVAASENPFDDEIKQRIEELDVAEHDYNNAAIHLQECQDKISGFTWLYNRSSHLRSVLMNKAVTYLNADINKILADYFDGEIRLLMTLDDKGSPSFQINKSGFDCSVEDLSGGQRRMLSFAFMLSRFKAAQSFNNSHIDLICIDESLDGFDGLLKLKAYNALQHLQKHFASILLIDHNEEFQNLFNNKIRIVHDGVSVLEYG